MSAQPPPGTGDATPVHDLEYDLAHEASEQARFGSGRGPAPRPDHIQVGNQTADYDGDYGYDLAHDIPRQAPRSKPRKAPHH